MASSPGWRVETALVLASDPPAESQTPASPQGISRIATGGGYDGRWDPTSTDPHPPRRLLAKIGCARRTGGRAAQVVGRSNARALVTDTQRTTAERTGEPTAERTG